jgi:hypothetical protein
MICGLLRIGGATWSLACYCRRSAKNGPLDFPIRSRTPSEKGVWIPPDARWRDDPARYGAAVEAERERAPAECSFGGGADWEAEHHLEHLGAGVILAKSPVRSVVEVYPEPETWSDP